MVVSATTTPSSPRGASAAGVSTGWMRAIFIRSRSETIPTSWLSKTTGMWR